ncbi:hypothetical protein [Microbulbifer sp. TYP-18]|uniref:hypothetical protein n=1 Tax=Microbulbifer sp. TYP-18 TaxID=3230024 RepID=UPI0034C5B950
MSKLAPRRLGNHPRHYHSGDYMGVLPQSTANARGDKAMGKFAPTQLGQYTPGCTPDGYICRALAAGECGEGIVGEPSKTAKGKRGPTPRLQR